MDGRKYSLLQFCTRYLRYYFSASNGKGHGIHSPFVYAFVRAVLMDKKRLPEFSAIENLRKKLKKNVSCISTTDFGAGSPTLGTKEKSIGQIARQAAKPAKLAQLLFRSVRYFKAASIVELGSSLGLTTAYLARANNMGKLFSLEGDPAIAQMARDNLSVLQITNAKVVTGNFNDTLSPLLNELAAVDLVYIDGNHRLQPTLQYFEQVLTKSHHGTIIILDDIHWSKEMEAAWKSIKKHAAVTTTIDLFFLGYVFISPAIKEKQDFTIRY
jgi:predicted O-methyltransferase YrrM